MAEGKDRSHKNETLRKRNRMGIGEFLLLFFIALVVGIAVAVGTAYLGVR